MAVIAASMMTLRPGAYEAFLEQHKKVKPILERCRCEECPPHGHDRGPETGAARWQ